MSFALFEVNLSGKYGGAGDVKFCHVIAVHECHNSKQTELRLLNQILHSVSLKKRSLNVGRNVPSMNTEVKS